MELLLMGATMGIAGGLMPSPLHLISLSQVALNRWVRAIFILVGLPLIVDGSLLLVTFFSFQLIPTGVAHYIAYLGGAVVISFATYALLEMRRKTRDEMARSTSLTYASVSVALLAELSSPGTWIFWLTVAGPLIAEGRIKGYWHIVPFFAGSLLSYYGAAIFSVWLMAWGASLHHKFNQRLFLAANVLLLVLGISYLARAYFGA
jgi:threonine/homoserine/homoserine lactone efflux protein